MLKTLSTLVKINKFALDEKRKELGLVLDKKEGFLNKIKTLHEDLKKEVQASKSVDIADASYKQYLSNYMAGVKTMQEDFQRQAEELEPKIVEISSEITEKFAEMKKFEIMKDIKIEEIEAELKRKEQLEIDAIAIEKFIRNEANR